MALSRMDMPMTKEQIFTEAMALDPKEREALAERLLLTLNGDRAAIEAAWVEECKLRVEAVDRGELPVVPGEQVMRQLRDRLRK
jgi:putative addiction module component (TIGR02574 family)